MESTGASNRPPGPEKQQQQQQQQEQEQPMFAPTLAEMRKNRHFFPSGDFIISCGCVTLDPARKKVLLIFNKKFDMYQLPKGRKNIGEDLLAAALRETYEESGVAVEALPLLVPTRATVAASDEDEDDAVAVDGDARDGLPARPASAHPAVTTDRRNCEPCAVVHSPDPYSGAMKHVFYFVARGDSTAPVGEGTQEEWERFDTVWTDADEAAARLTFAEDGMVVRKALEDAKRSGLDF